MISAAMLGLLAVSIVGLRAAGAISGSQELRASTTSPRNLELHIASNGTALIRGARVEEVRDDHLMVASDWGSLKFTWQINTGNAKVLDQKGEVSDEPLVRGEYVTVTGTLSGGGDRPAIDAKYVRRASAPPAE